ncbi:MAG: cytochrome c oxidase subunit I [Burkholderiaceae bacterium]
MSEPVSPTRPSSPLQPSPIALHHRLRAIWGSPGGWESLATVNHSAIGLRFIVTALMFFLIGGVLAMLIRTQLATSDNAFVGHELYGQLFTMHGTIMMFLFAIPMLEGFAMYLLPKMLGARDLAYPRLGAFSYWCYLFGGLMLISALAMGLAPGAGWFMYTPLSGPRYSPGIGADVWLIGVTFAEVSAVCGAIELAASILRLRAPGMSLARMPLFAWYMLVTAAMMLIGFPPLILGSLLLEVERAFGWPFFEVARGGDPLLWQHLFWLFGHPEVYIIFLPAAGMVSTMIPVFARHPIIGYRWIVASVIAMGFISFGLWVHHMFTVGIPHLAQVFFSAASMLVAVPTAIQFFAWIATLWAGRPVLKLPMLYLFGFLVVFIAGGLTGVMLALVPFNWQAHDTHFVVAHLHYVLVGGMVFPLLAAMYYWLPHVTGRLPSENLGKWAFWLIFIGFNLTFLLMHLTGLLGMPRRVHVYAPEAGWDWLNLLSSIGAFIQAIGFALLLLDLFLHARMGRGAGRNPWGAGTLEWAMPTPASDYNFASQPQVDSREPVWERPRLGAELAAGEHWLGAPATRRETLSVDVVSGQPERVVVLPGNSWLPLQTAAAAGVFFLCLLFKAYVVALLGLGLTLVLAVRWAWQTGQRSDDTGVQVRPGLRLLSHRAGRTHAPGWAGMQLGLAADATLFGSLLFGYLYLWLIAPNWPAPQQVEWRPWLVGATLAVSIGAAVSAWRARAVNKADGARPAAKAMRWLASAVGLGLAASAGLAAIMAAAVPPAVSHAHAAVASALLLYAAVHTALGALLAGFVWARCRAGFVSPQRCLEPELACLWWSYTLPAVLIVIGALYGLPGS